MGKILKFHDVNIRVYWVFKMKKEKGLGLEFVGLFESEEDKDWWSCIVGF